MKHLWLFLCVVLPLGCQPKDSSRPADSNSTSAAATSTDSKTMDAGSQVTQFVMSVDGMHCSVACPPQVRDALASVPGVSDVDVDFETKQARLKINPGQFNQAVAVKALHDAGFEARVN